MLLRKPLQTVTKPVTPKLLQTVTNSYKQLQTSYPANRYEPLQNVTNRYKPLRPKPLRTVTLPVWYYGIAISTVTAQSSKES